MNRPSAYSKGNAGDQVEHPKSSWPMKSGARSCSTCWRTLTKSTSIRGKFSTNLLHSQSSFLHPTTLLLVGAGNFLTNTGIIQGHLLTMNERPFLNMVRLISLHGSKERYLLTNLARSKFGVPSYLISFLSCFTLQCQSDLSISAEIRQVGKGFDYKVSSFNAYDVNGYRFHTTSYEKSRPNAKTTNTGVYTLGVVTHGAE